MMVVHVYILGKSGAVERSYDFLQNNGKDDSLEGCAVIIPYDENNQYPLTETDTIAIISNRRVREDH